MSWVVGAAGRNACVGVLLITSASTSARAQSSEPARAGFPPAPVTSDARGNPGPGTPVPAPTNPAPTSPAPASPAPPGPVPGATAPAGQPYYYPPVQNPSPAPAPVYVAPVQQPTPEVSETAIVEHRRPLELPPRPELPPPPPDVCQDGRASDYETGTDCGGICRPCTIDDPCRVANDCVSGLCKGFVCHERLYDPDEPVPPGYHLEPATRDRATTARNAGIGFFAASYGAAYIGALASPSSLAWLYVPLVGPFLPLKDAEEFAPEGGVRLTKMLLVTDGAFQIAGALLWLGGALGRGQQLLKNGPKPVETARIWVSPNVGPNAYGVRVDACF